ncbi:T9SS type A sorting domain-containing protein [Aureisphaera sp. CAU 1614]|uniref:T9SS type A sorting domain-containing protein n=1 Tax=Halomarinibacterium sedimenti TaxID=2857106 RepID=A0A9X1FQM2_9FLAO|nr:YCF48-related protein [Halomarinibacterium sedimenti]MBW2938707.1 T9SS type A sorting domain-containing protein [Halomarinibacterium sedimenti]
MNKNYYFIFLFFFSFGLLSQNWDVINPKPSYNTPTDIYFVDNSNGFILNDKELLSTSDSGANWQIKLRILSGNDFDFYNSYSYIVGKNGYILKSIDYGDNWSEIQTVYNNTFNSVSIVDADTVFISGFINSNNSLLIRSFDGGNSWETMNFPSNTPVHSIFFSSNLVGHAACSDGRILKTTDGGNNWFLSEQGTTTYDFTNLYFYSESIGYALRQYGGIYKTLDGGSSWFLFLETFEEIYSLHFIDENIGYFSGEDGLIIKTIDGGNTWEDISFVYLISYSNMTGIYFVDENNGFVTGERGRIAKTNNAGNSWNLYSFNYEHVEIVDFINSEVGYVKMDNKIYKTIDGGNTWNDTELPSTIVNLSGFDFIDENIGFASSYRSSIYKTIDGGENWELITGTFGINNNYPGSYEVKFIDHNVGFVCGSLNSGASGLFKTLDGGENWEEIAKYDFYNLQMLNSNVGFAHEQFFNHRKLYKTLDGGYNWFTLYEAAHEINSFHFVNEQIGFLVGYNGMVEKTVDGGENWSQLNIPHEYYDIVEFYSESYGFVVDSYGKIYITLDGGENWEESLDGGVVGGTHTILDMNFTEEVLYAGGNWGKIIKYDINSLGIENFNIGKERFNIYPNPGEGLVWLESNSLNFIDYLELYDFAGGKIRELSIERQQGRIKINFSDLETGFYILKINLIDENFITKKIIIK